MLAVEKNNENRTMAPAQDFNALDVPDPVLTFAGTKTSTAPGTSCSDPSMGAVSLSLFPELLQGLEFLRAL